MAELVHGYAAFLDARSANNSRMRSHDFSYCVSSAGVWLPVVKNSVCSTSSFDSSALMSNDLFLIIHQPIALPRHMLVRTYASQLLVLYDVPAQIILRDPPSVCIWDSRSSGSFGDLANIINKDGLDSVERIHSFPAHAVRRIDQPIISAKIPHRDSDALLGTSAPEDHGKALFTLKD